MQIYTGEGYVIRLGKTAKENWTLLKNSEIHHYLFHLTSFPSGYVILAHDFEEVAEEIIIECAKICKAGTKYRNMRALKVDYCKCSNVSKGSKVGEIWYRSNRRVKTIKV